MKLPIQRHLPLLVTVGQVIIFPYYIIWLKQVAMTMTIFAWLFAVHSFAAAAGYQLAKTKPFLPIRMVYLLMGTVYVATCFFVEQTANVLYFVLVIQLMLGFLQGYFRAWHIQQQQYHMQAIHQYLLVGCAMLGLSFLRIISPVIFIAGFGLLLMICSIFHHKKSVSQ